MKDYSNYEEADCCAEHKELRYEPYTLSSAMNIISDLVYIDKLTGEIIYDASTIDLCALIAPIQDISDSDGLDPLTIDPLYTPSKFNQERIDAAEETKDWELVDNFDRIGNKHGRWVLNGVNLTRYDLYDLNDEDQENT